MLKTSKNGMPEPRAVAQSQRPLILLVEDNPIEAKPAISALCKAGYDVMHAENSWSAAACLRTHKFAFVLVDGGLEDARRDAGGVAARLIKERLAGIPYGRLSNHPELLPEEFQGQFCLCKKTDLGTLMTRLEEAVPLAGQLAGAGGLVPIPDLSQNTVPAVNTTAVVVAEAQLDQVDKWLKEHGVTMLFRSGRKCYFRVPEFDLTAELAQQLQKEFGARVLPEQEYLKQLKA